MSCRSPNLREGLSNTRRIPLSCPLTASSFPWPRVHPRTAASIPLSKPRASEAPRRRLESPCLATPRPRLFPGLRRVRGRRLPPFFRPRQNTAGRCEVQQLMARASGHPKPPGAALWYRRAMVARRAFPRIRVLSRQQGRELLDRRARAELGVSGAEFIRLWQRGWFRRRATQPEVRHVAILLPFARRAPVPSLRPGKSAEVCSYFVIVHFS